MFLLGEMPRDPFGGESRDLEPFGRVNNRESLYAPTVCDRPLSVLAGDLAKVIDFLDQRNRDLHPDRVAGSRRESSHPAVRCVILWALQRAYGPGQVHHAFAQQERANAMKNCCGFRFRDFHVFQIINRKGIDNVVQQCLFLSPGPDCCQEIAEACHLQFPAQVEVFPNQHFHAARVQQ